MPPGSKNSSKVIRRSRPTNRSAMVPVASIQNRNAPAGVSIGRRIATRASVEARVPTRLGLAASACRAPRRRQCDETLATKNLIVFEKSGRFEHHDVAAAIALGKALGARVSQVWQSPIKCDEANTRDRGRSGAANGAL